MKKAKRAVTLTLLAAVLLAALGAAAASPRSCERRTLRYFHQHKETLTAEAAEAGDTKQPGCSLDLIFNYWDGEHPIMEYIVVSRGIVPHGQYHGFFYSYDGQPVSFQNAGEVLQPVSETEWTWQGEGDNHGTVKWIEDHWFYFEASL